jgi:sugar lactone lactonase YvrE/uncharacterized protein YjdB
MKQFLRDGYGKVMFLFFAAFMILGTVHAQIISTIAGNGTGVWGGDGGLAATCQLHNPTTIALDGGGNIYIADYSNHRLRKINTSGIITTIAGLTGAGYNGDGIAASAAKLNQPNGVAVDATGNIYIAEMSGARIRKINTSGIISTLAGSGINGSTGDGGPATAALVNRPTNLVLDGAGNIYFADWGNNKIRMINTAGQISTIAGMAGGAGYNGDGIATTHKLSAPYSVSLDALGNLYISDENNHILRKLVLSTGILSTIAGTALTAGSSGDGGAATAARFNHPDGIVADAGQLYIADYTNNKVRKVDLTTGIVTTAVGNGTAGYGGDGGPATASTVIINGPAGVTVDVSGNLYIADFTNNRVRKVSSNNRAPLFDSGRVQNMTICDGAALSISPELGVTDSDVSQTATWSLYAAPVNGVIYNGASVVSPGVITTATTTGFSLPLIPSLTYIHTAGMPLMDSFVFRVNDGISIDSTKIIITVSPLPGEDVIHGPTTVCTGSTITLTNDSTGGTWRSKNPAVATITSGGIVTGVSAGSTDSIFYMRTNSCGSDSVFTIIIVIPGPAAITPSTAVNICNGSFVDLSDASTGGTWSASNANATVSSTGRVTGVINGNDTIVYTIGSCSVTKPVSIIGPLPITPQSPTICQGSTVLLSDASGGGTWSSSFTSIATVNSGGLVSGVSAGFSIISYTVGTCSALDTVFVISAPTANVPSSGAVCVGGLFSFTNTTGGGVWSVSNSLASVSGGVVTGLSAGVDTVTYTVGTCSASSVITINALPAPVTPSGGVSVCIGATTTLADVTSGGTWTSGSVGVATVSSGGVVTGIANGTAIISYTISGCPAVKTVSVNGPVAILPYDPSICSNGGTVSMTDATPGGIWTSGATGIATISGTGLVTGVSAGIAPITYTVAGCFTVDTINVLAGPSAITPSGAVSVCTGATISLGDVTTGGTWSSNATTVATVSSSGLVAGIAAGTATISYTVGTCTATKSVTVNGAAPITPNNPSICSGGGTVTLSDGVSGGTWTSSTPGIATVSATGLVTGVSAGIAAISYTIGTCSVIDNVTVIAGPAPITPPAPVTICAGTTSSFFDASPGGSWSSSASTVATVSGAGLVTGMAAGTATITYTSGTCYSVETVTVITAPAALSPTSANLCVGNTTTFTESVSGGAWSSSAPGIGSVAGGVVTGIAPGITTISYSIGTCVVSAPVTVSIPSGAGAITGPSAVCVGSSVTMTDAISGGTWSTGTPAIAMVSGTGIVLGVSGGIATISYTVANACGSVSISTTVTVVPAGVAAITGASSVCAGTFTTLTDATTGGSWSATNATATVTGGGLISGVSPGTDTIKYTVVNACGTSAALKVITVGPFLSAGTILGGGIVCVGSSITLTDLAPGGIWGASNTHASVAGGVVSGLSAGVDTISYTVTSTCGTAIAVHKVTVNALPVAGVITGPTTICIGTFTTYTNAAIGGVWSITNSNAVISSGGIVTPVSVGLDTISYTVTNTCGTASVKKIITIGSFLTAGTISGPTTVCIGSPATLTNGITGGVWSASNSHATIGGTGIVTGLTNGVDTISYTVTSACGTAAAIYLVTINAMPLAGTITGPSSICMGSPTAYVDAATGGTWSVSNAHATISGVGLITPVSAGIDTISYTLANACGTAIATKVITIGAFLTAGTISGPGSVCAGSAITLTDGVAGGTWAASNTHASVAGGIVTGLSGGIDTISYTVSSSCGTATATFPVIVNPIAVAGTIAGPSVMCTGTSILFTDPAAGGVWSSSNANATVSLGGIVSAINPGLDTISYTVTNVCGVASATKIITINLSADAGTITGPATLCVGGSVTLTDAAPGGVWSASNATATVSGTGLVTGITNGTDTIRYSVSNSCGTAIASYVVGIGAAATAGTITGSTSVCVSSLIILSDAVPGGFWSSVNANATVSTSGVVTGILPGIDTIHYTVTGPCGTGSATYEITINALPAPAAISGPSTVCVGDSVTLTNALAGGIWSASNPNAAVGSGTGIVTGVSSGTDVINYTMSNSCGSVSASWPVTVNDLADPGAISGPVSVCLGASITLTDAVAGGSWSAGNANATVSGSGVVTGIASGTVPVSYSVTNGCGTSSAIAIITVNGPADAGVIAGSATVCVGSGITLTSVVPGGFWTISNANALMAGPGIVQGVTLGLDTVYYTVSGACGSGTSSMVITINPVPVVSPITGPTRQCTGTVVTLASATTGGIWSSSTPSVAAIGTVSGAATGISVGVATITYTVTNIYGCPTSITAMDTVSIMASIPAITGPTAVCPGSSITLSDAIAGGTWSSASPALATVAAGTGVVTGVASGTAVISYMVIGTCGTSFVTTIITVEPLPAVAAITGVASECPGVTASLADATPGGVWSSSNLTIAIVGSSTGIVTGIVPGTVAINYTVTGLFGCTALATIINTVNAAPVVAPITGVANECVGATTVLSDVTAGGIWSSSNPAIATITGAGIVTGITGGVVTITYSVPGTGCAGIATVINVVNVIPLSTPITGAANICIGSTATLSSTSFGGVWSSFNPAIATISGAGLVTGVSIGTTRIYYSVSNGCGSMADSILVSIQLTPAAGAITGSSGVCQGASITLANAVTGGVWSSANSRATVTGGIVTGISAGLDTIKYTVTNTCGTAMATKAISVSSAPYPGIISGFTSVCEGSQITLSTSVPGGAWSSSNTTVASVSGGSVTGVAAGVINISYSVNNSCGTRSATHAVTVVSGVLCHTMVNNAGNSNGIINIYPNPSVGVLNIEAPVKVDVQVLGLNGKVLISVKDAVSIDVSGLADAVYMIMIYDQNNQLIKTSKFSKVQ